jgi:predicted  nucleic acid-binding Zn-ribbon protein
MKAFQKNINALETKFELLIQKWRKTLDENDNLKERNRELEEKLKLEKSDEANKNNSNSADTEFNNRVKLNNIEEALDGYLEKIDGCLELINIELNGK